MNTFDIRRDLEEIEVRINRVIAGDKPGDPDYLSQHDAKQWADEIHVRLLHRINLAYQPKQETNWY